MSELGTDPYARPQRRPNRRRRLSDRVLIAFHFACDQGDLEVAAQLIATLESMVQRGPPAGRPERRLVAQPLVAAYERLWVLRHPEARDS